MRTSLIFNKNLRQNAVREDAVTKCWGIEELPMEQMEKDVMSQSRRHANNSASPMSRMSKDWQTSQIGLLEFHLWTWLEITNKKVVNFDWLETTISLISISVVLDYLDPLRRQNWSRRRPSACRDIGSPEFLTIEKLTYGQCWWMLIGQCMSLVLAIYFLQLRDS